MRDWRDFDRDGEVDELEKMKADEMLCASREEHMALFGTPGDFPDPEMNDFDIFDDDFDDFDNDFDDFDNDDLNDDDDFNDSFDDDFDDEF